MWLFQELANQETFGARLVETHCRASLPGHPYPSGFTSVEGGDIALEVMSLRGQVVEKVVRLDVKAGWQRLKVDIQSLTNGVYFLKVSNGGTVETRKFIVNR